MELRIDGWRQGIRFAASHIVPGHPKCGRLHGHTYALHCVVEGTPDASGMIVDFGIVKDALKTVADELDHRLILPARSDAMPHTRRGDTVEFQHSGKTYAVPSADVVAVDVPVATAEHLASFVALRLRKTVAFPASVTKVMVGVDEGYGKGAWVTA